MNARDIYKTLLIFHFHTEHTIYTVTYFGAKIIMILIFFGAKIVIILILAFWREKCYYNFEFGFFGAKIVVM